MSINRALQRPAFWAALVVAAFVFQDVASAQVPRGKTQEEDLRLEEEWTQYRISQIPAMAKSSSAIDRAFGLVQEGRLESTAWNIPAQGRSAYGGIRSEYYEHGLANASSRTHQIFNNMHCLALGVPEGPWFANAQVHENSDYIYNSEVSEWESIDGARGALFSDPPLMMYGDPMMASTAFEETWPATGWPAPESVVDTWLGATTWYKWKRTEGAEAYGEFNDDYAARHPDGDASVLDISGRVRMIQFPAMEATFYQYEVTNNSSTTYTDVYLGIYARRRFMYWDGNESFPRWDDERKASYRVGSNYFTPLWGPGSHTDEWGREAPWAGFVFLESPTGSWKTDAASDTVDSPSTIITRLSYTEYGNRLRDTDREWGQYGAMSGDLTYFDEYMTGEDIWKADKVGGGNPVLMQDEHHWAFYEHDVWDMTDALTELNRTQFEYASSGPIVTWDPGESLDFVYAFCAAGTEQDLLAVYDKTIKAFQAQFATSGPPSTPPLVVQGGVLAGPEGLDFDARVHDYQITYVPSGSITLSWDGTSAESTVDAITGNVDFQGYKIYKSIDRGDSWGTRLYDPLGGFIGYEPVAQYDLDDTIEGVEPNTFTNLGSNTGLQHSWTDNNVVDGFEYWYAITSYDWDPAQDVTHPSFESALGSTPQAPTVVAVIGGTNPNGFVPGLVEQPSGSGTELGLIPTLGALNNAVVTVQVLDQRGVSAADYLLTITDTGEYLGAVTTNAVGATLVNQTTSDTLFTAMLPESAVYGADLLPPTEGIKLLVDSKWNLATRSDVATATYPDVMDPDYPLRWPDAGFWSGDTDPDDLTEAATNLFSVRIDFDTTATQMAYVYTRDTQSGYQYPYRSYNEFPGTAWDVSDPDNPRQINVMYTVNDIDATNGDDWDIDIDGASSTADSYHRSGVLRSSYSGATPDTAYTTGTMNSARYGSLDYVWQFLSALSDTFTAAFPTTEAYLHGNSVYFDYQRPPAPGTEYAFSVTAPEFDENLVDMDEIRVVPNPYRVFAEWDRSPIERKIQFINVPPNCTVEIYTLTGEFVASLEHGATYSSGSIGVVEWPLWSYEYTEVAYGLYLYVVKTFDGKFKKVGKFAIIR